MKRLTFIKTTDLGTGAITAGTTYSMAKDPKKKNNIGFIGVGERGRGLLNAILSIDWVEDSLGLGVSSELIINFRNN